MKFKDKITKMMQILKITNSQLAERLDVDMSLVSRWRTGNRLPSERGTHMEQIADFLIECAQERDLLDEFTEILGLSADSHRSDHAYLRSHLIQWLKDDNFKDNSPAIRDFINKVEFFTQNSGFDSRTQEKHNIPDYEIKDVYVGTEGKREAMKRFLHQLSQSEELLDVYFYSDESLEWITDDIDFYFMIMEMLSDALTKGHRLKIIQPYHQDFKSMMGSIERWLPVYLSGQIQTYYYPHEMKSIFGNTINVAGDIAALKSDSIRTNSHNSINFYITDKNVVASIRKNLITFIDKCDSLMHVFGFHDVKQLTSYLLKQGDNPGDLIALHQTLSTMTMPMGFLYDLFDSKELHQAHLKRTSLLKSNLETYKYIEIFSLPSLEDLDKGNLQIELSNHISPEPIYYDRNTFRIHLENVIDWLETYPNYSVIVLDKLFLNDVKITVKKDKTAILYKVTPYPIALAFDNKDIIDAFYSYIVAVINDSDEKTLDRNFAMERLKDYLKNL
ncbi:helix-turn-helix domain-containing protein [Gudongella sp. DL1XJH-153]|uniref:helix-turn-helix domain-containing protein n=1 Tax=Gudongella sp. DL1XJH-153 TaxID=3409804 RepID=UPI003BB63886